jgi:transcriptional antiterminator RfaH
MPWYVVVTRPRAELKVKDRLMVLGVSVCCPVRVEKRQWSDRVKKVEVPLLPSMLLVFLEVKDREFIFSVPGVVRYLFYLGKPAVVPKKEVDLLNDIEKKGTNVIAIKAIKAGDIIDVPGFGDTVKKGRVRHMSGNKCWVVLEQLGFVVTLKLE